MLDSFSFIGVGVAISDSFGRAHLAQLMSITSGCASISLGLGPLIFGASKDLFARWNVNMRTLLPVECEHAHTVAAIASRILSSVDILQLHACSCIDWLRFAVPHTGVLTLQVTVAGGLISFARFYFPRATCCCEI